MAIRIRKAGPDDSAELSALMHALWPDATAEEHANDAIPILAGDPPGTLPAVFFLAETAAGEIAGFIQAGLRSHADGCDPAHSVGFVEGWFVKADDRGRGVGAGLLREAEAWARSHGCREMASDTWIDHVDSQAAHEALGFEMVDRCVHYRKSLA